MRFKPNLRVAAIYYCKHTEQVFKLYLTGDCLEMMASNKRLRHERQMRVNEREYANANAFMVRAAH